MQRSSIKEDKRRYKNIFIYVCSLSSFTVRKFSAIPRLLFDGPPCLLLSQPSEDRSAVFEAGSMSNRFRTHKIHTNCLQLKQTVCVYVSYCINKFWAQKTVSLFGEHLPVFCVFEFCVLYYEFEMQKQSALDISQTIIINSDNFLLIFFLK